MKPLRSLVQVFLLFVGASSCASGPAEQQSSSESEESGADLGCPQGGRRVALAYVDGMHRDYVRLFIDLDGDGLALTSGETLEFRGPLLGSELRGVGWRSSQLLLLAGADAVYEGELSEDFSDISWRKLSDLPGSEAGNAFLAGFMNLSAGGDTAWALFDLPWTPQLVRVTAEGLFIEKTLMGGVLGDAPRWLSAFDGRWLVSDADEGAIWDLGVDFEAAEAGKFIDTSTVEWEQAGWGTRPHATVPLGNGQVAFQDDGDSATIYLGSDADQSGSIDPEDEVSELVVPSVCHRPHPRHLTHLGERVIWLDDCDGTLALTRPNEASEDGWFSQPGAALLDVAGVSVGIAGWNADCVVEDEAMSSSG